jgi:acetate kinase
VDLAGVGLRVLVVNAGSTSLKLSVVAGESSSTVTSYDEVPRGVAAVAHRIVHGGERLVHPVVIDEAVSAELEALTELAPLHNRPALAALGDVRAAFPDVPHVAVFDTAFHATMPEEAAVYAVPARWRADWGIRRYGFHGLSVQWAAEQVRVPRLVVCHLGGGCSVTAVLDGRSVETTMGFSPLEGVPMATRSGSIDAEIVLHLQRRGLLRPEQIEEALEHESGLLGLSSTSARVEELEASGAPAAELALAVFTRRTAQAVAACVVALGGIDALVFTGGVGEGSARVRSDVAARLAFLGIRRVEVVEAREDIVAAREALRLLS